MHILEKNSPLVTVYVKALCYHTLEKKKSAIRNLKSEMGGPYLTKSYVIISAYLESAIR